MADKTFLDKEGLTELVSQTKSYVDSKIAAIPEPWKDYSMGYQTNAPIIRTTGAYVSTGEKLDITGYDYHALPGAVFGSGPGGVEYGYQMTQQISPALILAADSDSDIQDCYSGLTFSATPAKEVVSNFAMTTENGAMDVIFDPRGVGPSRLSGLHFRYWNEIGRARGWAALDTTSFGTDPANPSVILTSDNWEKYTDWSVMQDKIDNVTNDLSTLQGKLSDAQDNLSSINISLRDIKNVLVGTDEDFPYLELRSTGGAASVQIMTDGNYGNDNSNRGMGIKFQSSNNGADYGNLALKADPIHGWDNVLTLPNETGILATRNYVDDSRGIIVETVTLQVGVGMATGSITPSNAIARLEEVWQTYSGMKIPLVATVVYPGNSSTDVYVKRAILTDSQTNRYQHLVYGGDCDLDTFKWDGEGGTGVALSQALTTETIRMRSSAPAKLSIAFLYLG